jgi:hypothetical protein
MNFQPLLGLILRPLQEWYEKRYPSVVVALQHQGRTAVVRVAAFGQSVFVRSIKIDLLRRDTEKEVVVNILIPPHGQFDCPLPLEIVRALTLTGDVAVQITYKTASGREANSEARIFNLVGGDGDICKVSNSANHMSLAKCPKCGDETLFANSGVNTKKELEARKKAFENDLRKSCPNHESSRVKFWY